MKFSAKKGVKELSYFIGKACTLIYLLNGEFEITVELPFNWNMKTLPEILKKSFIRPPESVHILSCEENIASLN